ncbi:hypothetical protein D3C84_905010 [compost metagenome]
MHAVVAAHDLFAAGFGAQPRRQSVPYRQDASTEARRRLEQQRWSARGLQRIEHREPGQAASDDQYRPLKRPAGSCERIAR